jgi:hypothetical protein
MTQKFRAALVVAMATASTPKAAAGQNASADHVLRRVDSLQRRTNDLERRVGELEAVLRAQASRSQVAPASANSRDVASWRQLRRGMTMDEVRALLGEPESLNAGLYTTVWNYPNFANVMFDPEKVRGWSEPGR